MSEDPHRKPDRPRPRFPSAAEEREARRTIQRNWDKAERIREYLKQFPQRCVEPNETMEQAQRYAGKAELAKMLQDTFWPEEGEEE